MGEVHGVLLPLPIHIMCGLVGFLSYEENVKDVQIAQALLKEASIRGLHAFGATLCGESEVHTVKYFNLQELSNYIKYFQDTVGMYDFIAHTRYSTSGDWQDLKNNQPINVGGYSLAFNGVISMKTKEQMEHDLGQPMQTDNDGELFIRHMMGGGDPVDFVMQMSGSFAGLWYDPDGQLYALRNERRPLWYFTTNTGLFFTSTKDIVRRACGDDVAVTSCNPGQLYSLADMR